jgi:U3 small nucleolar RNA-associated protein 25
VQEVIFYSLPDHAAFYKELVNMVHPRAGQQHCHAQALFSDLDFLALKRVVGKDRARRMVKAKSKSFLFKVD